MAYLSHNIVINRGVSEEFKFAWEAGLELVEMSSMALRMEVRSKVNGDVFDVLTTENGRLVFDAKTGAFSIIFPADVSAGLAFRGAVFALDAKSANGVVYPLIEGTMMVKQRAIEWPKS